MKYPYMMVADFDSLCDLRSSAPQIFHRLEIEAQREIEVGVYTEHPKMSITFMGLYIINQALMYRVTGERKYLDCAVAWMDAVSAYPHWGNDKKYDVDLSASWVLWGLSVGYDWLSGDLGQDKRNLYLLTIERHLDIFLAYVSKTTGKGWATEYWQNHNWINMSGIASAGYVLKRHGIDDRGAIALTESNFAKVYAAMAEDGSNYEGCSYWRYGGSWLFFAAYLIRGEGGPDYLGSCSYLKNTFYYRLYQSNSDLSKQLNFGDTHDLYSSHCAAVYYLVAHEYQNGYAQKLGNLVLGPFFKDEVEQSKVHPGLLPEAGLEYLFYDPSVEEEEFDALSLYREFPDLGLVSIRSSWDKDAVVFSAKCGYPGGKKQWTQGWPIDYAHPGWQVMSLSHHHPDNLSYQLVIKNRYFIADDGYDRDIMPYNHSVPLVDGFYTDAEGVSDVYRTSAELRIQADPLYRPDKEYYGTLSPLHVQDGCYSVEGNSERTYPLSLRVRKAKRVFFTDCRHFLFILTQMDSLDEHTYTMVMNTFEKPVRLNNDKYVYEKSHVFYQAASDYAFLSHVESFVTESIMTPQEPDKKCHVEQMGLMVESAEKQKGQIFGELLSFDGTCCNLTYGKDGFAFSVHGHAYCFTIDPKNGKVQGGRE